MRSLAAAAFVVGMASPATAHAFSHVVRPGETLAAIAQRVYGNAKMETVLAGANFLDVQGGSAPVPGMRLEIPAPGFHRVSSNETWITLALEWLGDGKRADVLARINHGVAWIPPVDGQEIQIPYVLTVIAADGDRMDQLAHRYIGDANRAWELEAYNGRKASSTGAVPLKRGEVVLVPILDLTLTEEGKRESHSGLEQGRSAEGRALDAQRHADAEIPLLLADLRAGRYVEVVARGNRILGSGELTKVQLGSVHRALLDAYVALDAPAAAAGACAAFRINEPTIKWDPAFVSPKVRNACPPPSPPPPPPSGSASAAPSASAPAARGAGARDR
ncbi:LysM peptidoglycan-binding domain-containing protein [Pendulispora rubella]|uniref:LysM peptidoglycan-binding domain-containing protein n=1 Tax=Pendulispora rubella TaxID=2741070 RepID=A0ABZ2L2G1_9BACT